MRKWPIYLGGMVLFLSEGTAWAQVYEPIPTFTGPGLGIFAALLTGIGIYLASRRR